MKLETFFEKFEVLAEMPGAVGKLRELVRELAVVGKLVAQDPGDEPVDALVKNIESERRAKRTKDYPPVELDEAPFQVPDSWTWIRLGNVSLSSDSGWSPQCESESRSGTDWGVLKVSAVSWGNFKPDENKALPSGIAPRPDCEVKSGDFLLSRANTDDLVARGVVVNQTPPRLMMSDKIVRFTFPAAVEPRFINLANASIASRAYYARNASGTSSSMKNISREVMCNLPIPLPPLAEQKRIVAKFDEVMALCDRLEAQQQERETRHTALARASLDQFADAPTPANFNYIFNPSFNIAPAELRNAILTLAVQGKLVPQDSRDETAAALYEKLQVERSSFAEIHRFRGPAAMTIDERSVPFSIPMSWKWCRLSSVVGAVTDGDHLPPPKADNGVAFLTIGNITTGSLEFEGSRFVPEAYYQGLTSFRRPARGDILYTVVGATYGRPAFVDTDRPFCVQRHIAILKTVPSIDVRYLMVVLRSPLAYAQATSSTTGTAQPTIPLGALRNFLVPLPPITEQRRIVAKVEQLTTLVDRNEVQLSTTRSAAMKLLEVVVAELT